MGAPTNETTRSHGDRHFHEGLQLSDLALMPSSEGVLLCHVCPEQARCLLDPVGRVAETGPVNDGMEEIEKVTYCGHCAEIITEFGKRVQYTLSLRLKCETCGERFDSQ
jgi:hypothetical protein